MTITYGAAMQIVAPIKTGPSLSASIIPRQTTSGSASNVVINDGNYSRETGQTTVTDKQIVAERFYDRSLWTSGNPSVATIDQSGFARYVSSGTAVIRFSCELGEFFYSSAFSQSTGQTVNKLSSFVTGSYAKYVSEYITALLAGKTFSGVVNLNTFSPSLSLYNTGATFNSGVWCGTLDLSFYSVLTSDGGSRACLIAPDLILQTKHNHNTIGTSYPKTFTFRNRANAQFTSVVTLANTIELGAGIDLVVSRLSTPMPDSVIPIRCANERVENVFGGVGTVSGVNYKLNQVLAIAGTQDFKLVPVRLSKFYPTYQQVSFYPIGSSFDLYVLPRVNPIVPATDWCGFGPDGTNPTWVGGDSSSPLMLVDAGGPILFGMASAGASAQTIHGNIAAINAAAVNLGSSYTVTQSSISGFPTF